MSIMSDAKSYYNYLQTITDKNNAESSKQADKMMAFQREMSDTAHQREVADLKAAGLNPVLSAGGQGASSPQGAMGQTDMSAASALTQYLSSLINQQTAISVAQINAGAAKYAADMSAANPNTWAGIVRSALFGNDTKKDGVIRSFMSELQKNSSIWSTAKQAVNFLAKGRGSSAGQERQYDSAMSTLRNMWNAYQNWTTGRTGYNNFVAYWKDYRYGQGFLPAGR